MIDASLLQSWGLPGLFASAFLAGSVVPAPSEAVLVALLVAGVHSGACVGVATAGNVLGAFTLFLLGRLAAKDSAGRVGRWIDRRRRAAGNRYVRGERWMRRWGGPVLLLSWLPVVGDLLVLAAGAAGMSRSSFLFFTTLGKAARYLSVAASTTSLVH